MSSPSIDPYSAGDNDNVYYLWKRIFVMNLNNDLISQEVCGKQENIANEFARSCLSVYILCK